MLALMEAHPLATVITAPDGLPFASHLPLMVKRGDKTVLIGHMAKANEQWRHFEQQDQTLIIFHGPGAYISPSLYHSPGVPTWNYAAIHIHGKPTPIMDADQLKAILDELTAKHEQLQPTPWRPDYPPRLLEMIVGFEMEIERIEGKYKLSQNRPEVERLNIIQTLSTTDSATARGVAQLMQKQTSP